MRIETFTLGPIQTNCYLVSDDAGNVTLTTSAQHGRSITPPAARSISTRTTGASRRPSPPACSGRSSIARARR